MIRAVVADDHAIVRAGIRALLAPHAQEIAIVAEAAEGRELIEAVARVRPELALVDLTMPGLNGLDAIARLRSASPRTRVLVLSMHSAPEFVRPALRAGAQGYLVKGSGLDDLVQAIRTVAGGGQFFGAAAAAILASDGLAPGAETDDLERLTPREREILQLVAEGRTNREMAAVLGLSAKTVDTHRTSLMRKLDLHSAQALTRYALRRRLVSDE